MKTETRSPQRKYALDMKDWKNDMQTSLRGIANRARKDKKARFGSLYGLLNENNLRWCFCGQICGLIVEDSGVPFIKVLAIPA